MFERIPVLTFEARDDLARRVYDRSSPGHFCAACRRKPGGFMLRPLTRAVGAAAGVLLGLAAHTAAAQIPAAERVLTAAERKSVLEAVESTLAQHYVFPDRTAAIVAHLREQAAAGRYDTADPGIFARRVSEDLRASGHDGHLYLDFDPARYRAELAPEGSPGGLDAFDRARAERTNHGLAAMELLPGNIRYLRISEFQWIPGETPAVYDAALRFLSGADAIILDLRDNGGGEGDAANYLLSAIMPPGTLLFVRHEGGETREDRTQAHPQGISLEAKPLYVLTDGHTGSAAEALSYAAQQEHAGVIVGAATYGAANNNRKFPIAPFFVLSVSYARPVSPVSGTNWEGRGVQPDIPASGLAALDVALLEALDTLSRRAASDDDAGRAGYAWARVEVNARLHPVALPTSRLRALAGTYGPVTVRLTAGGLRFTRADRPAWETDISLTPLTPNGLFAARAFAFDDLRVHLTGSTLEFLYGSEADSEVFARSP